MAPTIEGDLQSLRLKRGSHKQKFTRRCNTYRDRQAKGDPVVVLTDLYEKIDQAFVELEDTCDRVIDHLVMNNHVQGDIEEAHKYLAQCESDKCDIQVLHSNQLVSVKQKQPDASLIKLESLKFPIFEGDHRKYPTFKDDVETIVLPKYGQNACALRQCLGEIPKLAIRGCEKSFESIIAKLDQEYGDPRMLVDLVINDLKKFIVVNENDNVGFINMVTIIEQCYLDLKKVDLDKEMNSVTIVSMIEKILPRSVKRDWIKLSDEIIDKSDLFLELLKFLLKEKRVTEYSNSDVRNVKFERSHIHNVSINESNELHNTLKQMKDDQANTQIMLNDLCERMKGNSFVSNINSVKHKCWIHNFEGHHISACGRFRSMSSSEKLESAKRKGICYRCLDDQHLSKFCNSNITCSVKVNGQNCNKPHHYLLHDSFIIPSRNYSVRCQTNDTLLEVSTVYSYSQPITVLWDSASDTTLITHRMAKSLGLQGKNVMISITKVGNVVEQCSTKQYRINIHDRWGVEHSLSAVGMDEIASDIPHVELSNIGLKFPGLSSETLN